MSQALGMMGLMNVTARPHHNLISSSPEGASVVPVGATSLRFAQAARALGDAARRRELTAPAFRSPPRLAEVDRTIRRRFDGTATVSVRLRDRPWSAVLGDLVEGVVVANNLSGPAAMHARAALWAAVADDEPLLAA